MFGTQRTLTEELLLDHFSQNPSGKGTTVLLSLLSRKLLTTQRTNSQNSKCTDL